MGPILSFNFASLRSLRGLELSLLGAIIGISIYIGLSYAGKIIIDDPFITYRYARNIAEGLGFVYNPGERVLSTTTPLYTMILALSYFASENLPANSSLFSWVCSALAAPVIYKIFSREHLGPAGLLASFLVCTNLITISTFGMETGFFSLLLLVSIYCYLCNKLSFTALFLGLSVLTRIDGFIMVVALGAHYLASNLKRMGGMTFLRRSFKPLLLFMAITAPWFLFSAAYFGHLIPSTLNTKMAQLQSQLCWQTSFSYDFLQTLVSSYPYHALLFALGCIFIFLEHKGLSPFIIYFVLYLLAYTRVPYYHWYALPPMISFLAVSSVGFISFIDVIWSLMESRLTISRAFSIEFVRLFSVVLVLAFLSGPLLQSIGGSSSALHPLESNLDNRYNFYRYLGEKFKDEGNISIGAVEVGILGYYSDMYIFDFCGLLQPHVAYSLGSSKLLHTYRPDYILYAPLNRVFPIDVMHYYTEIDRYSIPPNEEWILLKSANSSCLKTHEIKTDLDHSRFNIGMVKIGNVSRASILEHPISGGKSYLHFNNLSIHNNSTLDFGIILNPQVWSPDMGDGVLFEVFAEENGFPNSIFSKYIDPKNNLSDRRFYNYSLDLSEFGNRTIRLTFATSSGPKDDSSYDWALWLDPKISWGPSPSMQEVLWI
jgi:hypothetical protein